MTKKVLIIEDYRPDYERIRNELIRSDKCNFMNIYPNSELMNISSDLSFGGCNLKYYENEFSFFKNLYREINASNFNEIFEIIFNAYGTVDYYVLDVNLTDQDNKEGIKFYDFLINEKNILKERVFIVTPKKIQNLKIKVSDEHFILKDQAGEYAKEISKKIV